MCFPKPDDVHYYPQHLTAGIKQILQKKKKITFKDSTVLYANAFVFPFRFLGRYDTIFLLRSSCTFR